MSLVATRTVAQTRGLPEYFPDVLQGVAGAIDVGFDTAGFRTVALSGVAAVGHVHTRSAARGDEKVRLFNVAATVGHFSRSAASDAGWSVGGAVNLLGFLQTGADYSKASGTARVHLIPISAALGLFDCLSAKLNVLVWAGGGLDLEHVSTGGAGRWERSWGSASGGVRLDLRNGLGAEVAVGGRTGGAPTDPYRREMIGVGLRFTPHNIVRLAPSDTYGCHFAL